MRPRRGRPPHRRRAPAAGPVPSTALERDHAEMKDRLLRTLAEMENLRKRTDREVADSRLYGVTSFARDVLGVADNMRRALDSGGAGIARQRAERRQSARRRRRVDRARTSESAGEKRRAAIHAARREIRSQPASSHVRSARCDGAGRQRRAGGAARLYDRRAGVAPGSGRGVEGRTENGAGFARPTTTPRPPRD